VLTSEACERAAKQQRRKCVSRIGPFYVASRGTLSCCEELIAGIAQSCDGVEFVALRVFGTGETLGTALRTKIEHRKSLQTQRSTIGIRRMFLVL